MEYLKVRMVKGEWLGRVPPDTFTIIKQKALELVQRGVAEIVDATSTAKPVKQTQEPELKKEQQEEQKSIDAPEVDKMIHETPMNKMIQSPPKKKAGRPKKRT